MCRRQLFVIVARQPAQQAGVVHPVKRHRAATAKQDYWSLAKTWRAASFRFMVA